MRTATSRLLFAIALALARTLALALARIPILARAPAPAPALSSCKPSGSILLLEHGVSSWGIISWWQQRRLNRHVARWGCYWNRDILGIVKAAGLRVVELRRSNFGTIYFIRCQRPDAPPDD